MNGADSERYLTPYIVLFTRPFFLKKKKFSNKTYTPFSPQNNLHGIFHLPPLSAIPTQNKLFPKEKLNLMVDNESNSFNLLVYCRIGALEYETFQNKVLSILWDWEVCRWRKIGRIVAGGLVSPDMRT